MVNANGTPGEDDLRDAMQVLGLLATEQHEAARVAMDEGFYDAYSAGSRSEP